MTLNISTKRSQFEHQYLVIEDKVTSRTKKLQEVFDETELTALHDLGYVATVNWVERVHNEDNEDHIFGSHHQHRNSLILYYHVQR